MTKEEEIQELKAINKELHQMLNRAIGEIRQTNNRFKFLLKRTSFQLERRFIQEVIDLAVEEKRFRRKSFYPGFPGVPRRIINREDPDKGTDKK